MFVGFINLDFGLLFNKLFYRYQMFALFHLVDKLNTSWSLKIEKYLLFAIQVFSGNSLFVPFHAY